MSYPTPPESLPSKVVRYAPTALRRFGIAGAGIGIGFAAVVTALRSLSKFAGVQEVEYTPEEFPTKTIFAKHVKWTSVGDQVNAVDELVQDGRALLEVGVQTLEDGLSMPGHGRMASMKDGDGHAYEIQTETVTIPEDRRLPASDPNNHNWLRGILSSYQPYGRQLPPSLSPIDVTFDVEGMPLITSRQNEEIEEFDKDIVAKNTPVLRDVALGNGGNVSCLPTGVIHDTNRGVIVRWGYMSTLMPHPLAGRALWGNAVNYRTGHMANFYIGAGQHKFSTVDWLNQPIAAFVFITMFRVWAGILATPGTGTPTLIGDPARRRELLAAVDKADPHLAACRKVAYGLDAMAIGGGVVHEIVGGEIVGPPDFQEVRIEEISLDEVRGQIPTSSHLDDNRM